MLPISMKYIWHGHERAAAPLYFGLSNQVDRATDPAQKAGLREGDRVLEVNGRPVRSFDTLMQQTNDSRPGDPMTLLIERKDGSRTTIQFPLSPQITGGKLGLSFRLLILTLQAVFPGFCLLIGLWVVAAKPAIPMPGTSSVSSASFSAFSPIPTTGTARPFPSWLSTMTWPSLHSSSACCSSASTSGAGAFR